MKKLAAFIALLGLTSSALADADKGLYLGAGVGDFNIKSKDIETLAGLEEHFSASDTSFKVFAGWRFNKFLGLELDYMDLGRPNDDVNGVELKTKINGVAPYITGTLPLGPIELFAKAGYLFYDLKVDVDGDEVSQLSGNDDDFVYGAGLGLTLFGHLNAALEYEVIDLSGAVKDADVLWLTGAWRF